MTYSRLFCQLACAYAHLFAYLSNCLYVWMFVYLSTCMYICISVFADTGHGLNQYTMTQQKNISGDIDLLERAITTTYNRRDLPIPSGSSSGICGSSPDPPAELADPQRILSKRCIIYAAYYIRASGVNVLPFSRLIILNTSPSMLILSLHLLIWALLEVPCVNLTHFFFKLLIIWDCGSSTWPISSSEPQ